MRIGEANMQQVGHITYSSRLAPVNATKIGRSRLPSGATGILTLQGHLVILPAQFEPQEGAWAFLGITPVRIGSQWLLKRHKTAMGNF